MQTQHGAAAEAAILSRHREFSANVSADWDHDGLFNHPLSNLSGYVSSVSTDRSLSGSAPEEVLLIEGASAAELTVVMGGEYLGMMLPSIFSPYNTASPLFGIGRVGAEIKYSLNVHTPVGIFEYPQFIGNIRTITPNRADNTVTITALDRVEKLRKPIQFPPWAVDEYWSKNRGRLESQLCDSSWVIDHCLRQCDISPTPYRPTYRDEMGVPDNGLDGTQIWVNGTGSFLPSIGWSTRTSVQNFPASEALNRRMYERQGSIHPNSPNPTSRPFNMASLAVPNTQGDHRYWVADRDQINPAASHYFQFSLIERGSNGTWWRTQASQPVFAIYIGGLRVIQVLIGNGQVWSTQSTHDGSGGGFTNTITSPKVNVPTGRGEVRISVGWDNTPTSGTRVFVKADENTTSGGYVTVGAGWSGAVASTSLKGFLALYHPVGINDLVYSVRNVYGANMQFGLDQLGKQAKYAASVDAGLQKLTFMPNRKGDDAWSIITDVAGSEFGSVLWDEQGRFQFWNYQTVLGKQANSVRTFTLDDLSQLQMTDTLDSVRNSWSVSAGKATSIYGTVHEAESTDQYVVPAFGKVNFRVWEDDVIAPDPAPLTRFSKDPSTISGAATAAWNDNSKHGYVVQWYVNGVFSEQPTFASAYFRVYCYYDAIGQLVVRVENDWQYPARLAFDIRDSGGNTYDGDPALRIGGNVVSRQPEQITLLNDRTSIDWYGPRNLKVDGDWVQDGFSQNNMRDILMPRMLTPTPTTDAITVAGDPRIQLGDCVTLSDGAGFGSNMPVQIFGIGRTFDVDAGLTDTYTIEMLAPSPLIEPVPEPEDPEPIDPEPEVPVELVAPTVASAERATAEGGTVTVTKPTGTADKDLLVAVTFADPDGTAVSPATGFALSGAVRTQAGVGIGAVYTKVATASEPASYAFAGSTASVNQVHLLRVTGVNTTAPIDVVPVWSNGASSVSHVAPTIDPTSEKALLINGFFGLSGGTARTYTPPSGMTENTEVSSATNWCLSSVASQRLTTGAATGTKTATLSGAAPWISVALAVSPSGTSSGGGGTDPGTGSGTTAAAKFGWGTPDPQSDTFNYSGSLNPDKWWAYDGPGHNGNGTRTPANAILNGQYLRMKGSTNGDHAGIGHNFESQYGRWEVRARISAAPGATGNPYHPVLIVWPASDVWPDDGEYDFFEVNVGDDRPGAFLHYPHPWDESGAIQQEYAEFPTALDLSQWHNYAFEWTSSAIVGYVDGVEWFRYSGGAGPGGRSAMQAMPLGRLTIQIDNFFGTTPMQEGYLDIEWAKVYAL